MGSRDYKQDESYFKNVCLEVSEKKLIFLNEMLSIVFSHEVLFSKTGSTEYSIKCILEITNKSSQRIDGIKILLSEAKSKFHSS